MSVEEIFLHVNMKIEPFSLLNLKTHFIQTGQKQNKTPPNMYFSLSTALTISNSGWSK